MGIGVLVAVGALASCSSDDTGTGGQPVGSAGSGGSGTGGSHAGSGGTSSGSGGSVSTGGSTGTGGTSATGGSTGTGGSSDTDAGEGGSSDDGGTVVMPDAGSGAATKVFDGTTTNGWVAVPPNSWIVKDAALASTGAARGYLYYDKDYSDYRVIFSIRQVDGNHKPCVLVFTQRPPPALDALGGVQFQVPQGGHWDYRPGKNNAGNAYFTKVGAGGGGISTAEWARCEILVRSSTGVARMACCQLPGGTGTCKGMEILDFKDDPANVTKKGPFALQMHNSGIHDEYKDITIEENPAVDDLITTK
jgi:hypothetical protein